MRLKIAVLAALVACLVTAGTAQAETAKANKPIPNVTVFYGPSLYSSAPVSTATAYNSTDQSYDNCAPSTCGRLAVIGSGANRVLVPKIPGRDTILYGDLFYMDKAGDSHQVAHLGRHERVPMWTNITMFGKTVRYHLTSAAVYLLDPRVATPPPYPACISSCKG